MINMWLLIAGSVTNQASGVRLATKPGTARSVTLRLSTSPSPQRILNE
jgi:hypothetical protein